ncbi:MAG: type II toxin-antitoxin system VapC family toxin, partial [Holophagales bacterium]|nr:type II toxin-antitoxin system VapC family toxin [Holophagales bacterium]
MFVLDTNVVSELMRPRPEPAVERWLGRRPASDLYFTAIGEAEIRYGVAVMPRGARREALAAEIEGVL